MRFQVLNGKKVHPPPQKVHNNLNPLLQKEKGLKEEEVWFYYPSRKEQEKVFSQSKEYQLKEDVAERMMDLMCETMSNKFAFWIIPFKVFQWYHSFIYGKPRAIFRMKVRDPFTLSILAYMATGFTNERLLSPSRDFSVLSRVRTSFKEFLDEVHGLVLREYPDKDRPSVEGDESEDHRLLKAFVIYHLVNNLSVNPDKIFVENEILERNLCGDLVPDIIAEVNGKTIVIDVKSSIGKLPTDEIREVVEKYHKCSDEIWIVIRPIVFILFTRSIIKILKALRKKYSKKIEIMIPVKKENKPQLVTAKEFLTELERLIKS